MNGDRQPLRFAGTAGLKWTNVVRTFRIVFRIDGSHPKANDPEYLAYLRKAAGQPLIHELMDTAAVHRERTLPDGTIEHRFLFAVVMPDEGHNWFVEQIERERTEARDNALAEASAVLLAGADSYRGKDGPCRGVLEHQLRDYAMRIRDLA